MAQTGYTPILIYSSSTTTNAPAVGNLTNSALGSELAINITDGKLFYKDNANAIQVIGWKTTPTSAGGTGLTSYTAGDLLYYATGTALSKLAIGASGRWLGSSGTAPQWNAPAALTKTDDTNVTLTLGGSASTALLNAASLTLGWTGTLATTRGGTGLSSFTANGIVYASSTSALATNANFTYNGTQLLVGQTSYVNTGVSGQATGVFQSLVLGGQATGADSLYMRRTGTAGYYQFQTTDGGASSGILEFQPYGGTVQIGGDTTLTAGNLIVGTSGKGIDFSATPGTGTSELLADYEEGIWTPVVTSSVGSITSYTIGSATYTKIGRFVMATTRFTITNAGTGAASLDITLPFTAGTQNSTGTAFESALTGDVGRTWVSTGASSMLVAKYNNVTFCVTNAVITATAIYSV